MSKLIELQNKRADLAKQMRNFIDNVDSAKGMTADQEGQWKKMDEEIQALDKSIAAAQRVADIENRLDQFDPVNRPGPQQGEGQNQNPLASSDYVNAYDRYVRAGLLGDIRNALTVGTDSEGGYTVPQSWEAVLIAALQDAVVMRDLCMVTATASTTNLPMLSDYGSAGWVDEGGAYPESDPVFASKVLRAYKLGRIIKVSEELLNDTMINLEAELSTIFASTFGTAEEAAFISGNGTGKPTGVLVDAVNGVTAASATAITYDEIVNLVHSVREVFRRKSSFLTKDSTLGLMRRLKSSDGVPMWQPSLQAGKPDLFLGYPVRSSEAMPAAATGQKSMAFGDFKQYRITDRGGIVMHRLNELYAGTGHVGFRMRKRTDGKLLITEAVKTLTQA